MKCLHRPVAHRRDSQRAQFAVCLRDEHPPQRPGLIASPIERQHTSGTFPRRIPDFSVNTGCLLSLVFSHPFYGDSFAAERVGQQPLQGFDLAPTAFPNCLRNTHLQPSCSVVRLGPVDAVPIDLTTGGRTSHNCDCHLPVLLMRVLQILLRRETSRKSAPLRAGRCRVSPLSLFTSLQRDIRFFRHPIPAPPTAFLAVRLPNVGRGTGLSCSA